MLMLTKIIYNTPQSFSFFRVFPCQSKSYFSSLPLQFRSFLLLLRLHSLALVYENVPFSAWIFAFKFSAKNYRSLPWSEFYRKLKCLCNENATLKTSQISYHTESPQLSVSFPVFLYWNLNCFFFWVLIRSSVYTMSTSSLHCNDGMNSNQDIVVKI